MLITGGLRSKLQPNEVNKFAEVNKLALASLDSFVKNIVINAFQGQAPNIESIAASALGSYAGTEAGEKASNVIQANFAPRQQPQQHPSQTTSKRSNSSTQSRANRSAASSAYGQSSATQTAKSKQGTNAVNGRPSQYGMFGAKMPKLDASTRGILREIHSPYDELAPNVNPTNVETGWNVGARLLGATQGVAGLVGAVANFSLGVLTAETIIGPAVFGPMAGYNLDVSQAGFRTMISGEFQETSFANIALSYGVDPRTVARMEMGLAVGDLSLAAGPAVINSAARLSAKINNLVDLGLFSGSEGARLSLVGQRGAIGAESSAIRQRVLGNIAESKFARGKSNFEIHALIEKIPTLNVNTGIDEAVFWSGRGNRELAEFYASTTGKSTLEMTHGGQYLDSLKLFDRYSNKQAILPWERLSERFAQGASGRVSVFADTSRPAR